MITNKDLEIENISYTNKDFGQIYPELVELAKSLTNKWDPSDTNESDPGVVLLKLVAFLGDKLNYNIDKNTLEQFITSATQESSVRKLADMMAYPMRYYRSATTNMSFRYTGSLLPSDQEASGDSDDPISQLTAFTLKAFETTFKTEDDIIYTLLEDIDVNYYNKQSSLKKAIQGELKQLTVLSNDDTSNLIQLYNLDNDNRVYFPDSQVAENGIFINKEDGIYNAISNSNVWHRVDNLNDQQLGKKVFKFGYDSKKGFPYIQFPSDIAELIGDGLTVDYIVSQGVLGKVLNNKVTKFDKTSIESQGVHISATLSEDNYILSNSASIGAEDPETIDEVVSGFNKVVGTFDTLVSAKDYSNFLNRFLDENNNKVVSQVSVCDVRTDPDLSREIFTRDTTGVSYYTHELLNQNDTNKCFQLYLHGTTPINSPITTKTLYDRTYNPITESDRINVDGVVSEVKTLNQFFALPESTDIIIGNYTLKVNISPKYKLNSAEQLSVKNNVKQALFENFNASKVEFGQEIPYDSIVDVIKNADSRIKNVNLAEPEINYSFRDRHTSKDIPLSLSDSEGKEILTKLVAKNIIAGRLPLYEEDKSFSYNWMMDLSSDDDITPDVCAILAEKEISANTPLLANESVQVLQESYITSIAYPVGIYYSFYSNSESGTSGEDIVVKANQVYKLKANETLYICYTDSSDNKIFKTYVENDIIKPNFNIVDNSGNADITNPEGGSSKRASKFIRWSEKKELDITYANYQAQEYEGTVIPMFYIATGEQIDIVNLNKQTLSPSSNCFWYIKPKVNKAFDPTDPDSKLILNESNSLWFTNNYENGKYYYILEEGEFFIYPNDDMTSLNILSSGTKLICNKQVIDRYNQNDYIDLNELENSIVDEDIGTFAKAFRWEQLGADTTIDVVENTISTFIEDDIVNNIDFVDSGESSINSNWKAISQIEINDEDIITSKITNPIVRSVLSIYGSAREPQKALTGQNITIYYVSNGISVETESTKFTYSSKQLGANEYIQISPEIDSYNDLVVLQGIQYTKDESGNIIPLRDSNPPYDYLHTAENYSVLCYSMISSFESGDINTIAYLVNEFAEGKNTRGENIIKHADAIGTGNYTSQVNPNLGLYIAHFDMVTGKSIVKPITSLSDGVKLKDFVEQGDAGKYYYLSDPLKLKIYNYLEPLLTSDSGYNDLITEIDEQLNNTDNFDFIGEKNPYKYISSYDPLFSFFDANNIFNELTIAKIDFDSSEFNIIGSNK